MYTVTEWRRFQNRPEGEGAGAESTVDLTDGAARPDRKGGTGGPVRADVQVVTGVQPLSVAKVSAVFFGVLAVVGVLTATLLWIGATSVGFIGAVEGFMGDLGFEGFSFDALILLRAAILVSLTVLCAGIGTTVLLAVLYNLVSLLTGGIRIEVESAAARRLEAPSAPSGSG